MADPIGTAAGGRPGGAVGELRERGLPLSLREMAGRMGWRNAVDGTVPVASFLALNAALGLRWAVVGATVCSLALALVRRSRGTRPGWILWGSLAFLLARGALGAVTQSKVAYFGPGIATTFLAAGVFLGSVAVGRPAIGVAFRFVFGAPDPHVPETDVKRVFLQLSLAWGLYEVVAAVLQVWLLRTLSAGGFAVARPIVGTAGSVPLIAWSLYRLRTVVPRRAAQPDIAPATAGEAPAVEG